MSYPQGPYGQQPDPYGQQQPQYDGYQQQPQYGGSYGQEYGGFGGGQRPPTNKAPIIAVVSIVVLILAGVGVTGFIAPGFFLSDDKGSGTASGTTTSTSGTKEKDNGADAFIDKLVAAADDKNKTKLKTYKCSDATTGVANAIKYIDDIDSAELKDTREESKSEIVVELNIVVDGKDGDYSATIVKDDDEWCWQDFTGLSGDSTPEETTPDETATEETATAPPDGESAEGVQLVQSFLDKLNAGDGAGAAAMSCPDSTDQAAITEAAASGAALEIDEAGMTADEYHIGAPLTGTVGGESVTARTSAFIEDGAWCIYTFFAY